MLIEEAHLRNFQEFDVHMLQIDSTTYDRTGEQIGCLSPKEGLSRSSSLNICHPDEQNLPLTQCNASCGRKVLHMSLDTLCTLRHTI